MSGAPIAPGLVSVIVPVFDRREMLREAVASALAQTYRPIEVLVVDDGSTDGTAEECDRLARDAGGLVRVVHRENGGPGAARESGRMLARGEFLQYLDSDDLLLPGKLAKQVASLRRGAGAGVSYCWTRSRHADGSVAEGPWKGSGQVRAAMFPSFLAERWWDTPNPLYRRSVTDAAGPWLPLWREEDWEYDARIAAAGTRLAHVPEYLVEVRQQGAGGLSRTAAEARTIRSRCAAHEAILAHAVRAGIGPPAPEMARFSRELFLLARQAGAAGLAAESRRMFDLARAAAGPGNRRGLGVYRLAALCVGWRNAGALACWSDRFRISKGAA